MADLLYCKVVGTFRGFVADSDDVDDLPEFNIPSGSGVITPNVKMVKLYDEIEPKIFYPSPTKVDLNAQGKLSQGGRPYVNLLSPTADMVPNNFGYTIVMNLKFDGNSRTETWGPFSFIPTANSTQDLFDMVGGTVLPPPSGGSTGGGTTYVEDPNNEGFFIPA